MKEKRIIGRPFPKGVSGNPAGRPKAKALHTIIRERTNNGVELVNLWLLVMRGGVIEKDGIKYRPTLADMLKASAELADRGFGKAAQPIDFGNEKLTDAIVDAARAFTERIASLAAKREETPPSLKPKS
jgi:hypothetical protein